MAQTLAVVGGLVSALVIAELAVTKPGEAPGARALADDASGRAKLFLKIVTMIYIFVWILAGLAAFLKGHVSPEGASASDEPWPSLAGTGCGLFGCLFRDQARLGR